jgi:hypothetical protein
MPPHPNFPCHRCQRRPLALERAKRDRRRLAHPATLVEKLPGLLRREDRCLNAGNARKTWEAEMSPVDTMEHVRSGLFHIVLFNAARERVSGGGAFLSRGFLLTNNHVFAGSLKAAQVWIRQDGYEADQGWRFSSDEFGKLLGDRFGRG